MAYTQIVGPIVPIGSSMLAPTVQAIADVVETTALHTLGTRVKARDPSTGYEAEFMYCGGVASLAVGDAVAISGDHVVTRLVVATTGLIGVAMGAFTAADHYGWVAIDGVVPVLVEAGCAAGPAYATSTDGSLDDAIVLGSELPGAMFISAIGTPSTGKAYIRLNKEGKDGFYVHA
jgi:hypothetical protein